MKNFIYILNDKCEDVCEIIIPADNIEQADEIAERIISGKIHSYDITDDELENRADERYAREAEKASQLSKEDLGIGED